MQYALYKPKQSQSKSSLFFYLSIYQKMLIDLLIYVFVIVIVILICILYTHKRSKRNTPPKKKKVDKAIHFSNDKQFLGNAFSILASRHTTSCKNDTIVNYPCANLQKMENISNAPLIFRTNVNVLNISRNHHLITNNIVHFPNYTHKFQLVNATTYAYGFKNVIITSDGTVHSKCWNLAPLGCCLCRSVHSEIKYPNDRLRVYDKVIDIAHPWGAYVFHAIVECFSKIGYYIDELLNDESIKIHVAGSFSVKYFKFLGFPRSRFIGGTVFAKNLLSLERGSCGGSPSLLQVLSLRSHVRNKVISLNNIQNKYDVVLIRRKGVREIINHDEILKVLKQIYGENSVVVFNADDTLVNVLTYFTYAKLIVAPHGAGLSHLLFCDYDVFVLEFLTVPGMNGCYHGLATKLGLKYYGLRYNITKEFQFIIDINLITPLLKEIKALIYK